MSTDHASSFDRNPVDCSPSATIAPSCSCPPGDDEAGFAIAHAGHSGRHQIAKPQAREPLVAVLHAPNTWPRRIGRPSESGASATCQSFPSGGASSRCSPSTSHFNAAPLGSRTWSSQVRRAPRTTSHVRSREIARARSPVLVAKSHETKRCSAFGPPPAINTARSANKRWRCSRPVPSRRSFTNVGPGAMWRSRSSDGLPSRTSVRAPQSRPASSRDLSRRAPPSFGRDRS